MMTQGDIEKLTITMEKAAAKLEQDIMLDIVRRIKANEGMTSTAEYQIQRLRQLGLADQYIREEIQTYLKASAEEMDRVFRDVPESEYNKFGSLYQQMGMEQTPFGNHTAIQAVIAATMTQTDSTFKNISQSLGFTVQKGGKTEFLPIAECYQQTLDNAILGIATGAFDYTSALNRAVKEMTRSGLRTVDYASGRSYRIESATRTALMTGFSQIIRYMHEQTAEDLGTDDYEVSYHMGARPTHQWWQGRVYSYQESIFTCGLGTVTGLCGINCYHWYEPFIKGVSVRNYTDEQLDEMIQEENRPKSYRGKEYTTYTALQRQRKLELQMRTQRQEIALLKEGDGSSLDILAAQSRYRYTMNEYVAFSNAMKLPQQMERVYMDGLGKVYPGKIPASSFSNASKFDIMKSGARITNLSSKRAMDFAEMYYKEIRKFSTDAQMIAKNLGKSTSDIKKVKEYLFENKSLYDPDLKEWRRFDPDCAIAQSWQRLMVGKNIQPHDRILIEHELYEMEIKEKFPEIDHQTAHEMATQKYNYPMEVEKYYGNLKKHNEKQ